MPLKVNKKEAVKLIKFSLASSKRIPMIFYQTKESDRLERYLKTYADKLGYYFVTLDEFTTKYIREVADLYRKMSENDYCIIYIKMCDYIDYSTLEQQLALHQLKDLVLNPKYNMQIILDVMLLDNPQAISMAGGHPASEAYYTLMKTTYMPLELILNSLTLYWK